MTCRRGIAQLYFESRRGHAVPVLAAGLQRMSSKPVPCCTCSSQKACAGSDLYSKTLWPQRSAPIHPLSQMPHARWRRTSSPSDQGDIRPNRAIVPGAAKSQGMLRTRVKSPDAMQVQPTLRVRWRSDQARAPASDTHCQTIPSSIGARGTCDSTGRCASQPDQRSNAGRWWYFDASRNASKAERISGSVT